MTWRPCLGILITFSLFAAAGTSTTHADESLLADERWGETAFGLSLRPPADAAMSQQTADGAIITFRVDDDMTLRVYFRQAEEQVTLDLVRERAAQQFSFYYPSAVVVEDDVAEVRIAGRRGARWYFVIPSDQGEWIAGQAFMMIDPFTIAMFQYESEAHSYERSRKIFEALLDSVELMPPDELDAQRTALVEAGDAWLLQVTREQVEAVLPARQYLRVLQAGEDVGYQRVITERTEQLGEAGLSMRIQTRNMAGANRAYDSQNELFVGDGGQTEVWSSVTTLRPTGRAGQPSAGLQPRGAGPQGGQGQGQEQTWTDTGLRSRSRISVSREGPTKIDNKNWDVPPLAYLSQVMIQAAPALMAEQAVAGDPPAPMAFYAYDTSAGRLLLRTMRIEPTNDGGWRVFDRPAPDQAEQIFQFDPQGQLLERRRGDGRVYRPTTDDEIRAIWDE